MNRGEGNLGYIHLHLETNLHMMRDFKTLLKTWFSGHIRVGHYGLDPLPTQCQRMLLVLRGLWTHLWLSFWALREETLKGFRFYSLFARFKGFRARDDP